MAAEPTEWNVVVLGSWNLAILTPDGIRNLLFQAPSNSALEVLVPFDRQAPIRVVSMGVTVEPSASRLVAIPNQATAEELRKAATFAINGLEALPMTPVSAAGVNVRYKLPELPTMVDEALRSTVDDSLAASGHRIVARALQRSVPWKSGRLNINAQMVEDASGLVEFNFHLDSTKASELSLWLAQSAEMAACAAEVAASAFGARVQEAAQ